MICEPRTTIPSLSSSQPLCPLSKCSPAILPDNCFPGLPHTCVRSRQLYLLHTSLLAPQHSYGTPQPLTTAQMGELGQELPGRGSLQEKGGGRQRQHEGGQEEHPASKNHQTRAAHTVSSAASPLSLSDTLVIVSGWGKPFLQRLPETLMEVRATAGLRGWYRHNFQQDMALSHVPITVGFPPWGWGSRSTW